MKKLLIILICIAAATATATLTVHFIGNSAAPELKLELIDGGVSVESAGAPKVEKIPFYISLIDKNSGNSMAEDVNLKVLLINATGETVYSGSVALTKDKFYEASVRGYDRPMIITGLNVPTESIAIGTTNIGRICVSGTTASGQAIEEVNLQTSLLPANLPDRLHIQNVRMEVVDLDGPRDSVNAYVTFYYPGAEKIDLLSFHYNMYDANGNIVLNDLWQFEHNIMPGATFEVRVGIDPTWNPYYIEFTQYTFAEDDPTTPGNANVYWDDNFDDPHRTYIYQ